MNFISFYLTRAEVLSKLCPLPVVFVVFISVNSHLVLQNYPANFNKTWHKASLGTGMQVFSNKGPSPLAKIAHNYSKKKKIRGVSVHAVFKGDIFAKEQ